MSQPSASKPETPVPALVIAKSTERIGALAAEYAQLLADAAALEAKMAPQLQQLKNYTDRIKDLKAGLEVEAAPVAQGTKTVLVVVPGVDGAVDITYGQRRQCDVKAMQEKDPVLYARYCVWKPTCTVKWVQR